MPSDERVLILYSWNDDISQRRLQLMSRSPLVADIAFEHCFALLHEGEKISPPELVKRVSKHIESFNPTLFLVHTGAAFHHDPDLFVNALPQLKKKHRKLRFGCEHRDNDDLVSRVLSTGVFDDTPTTHEMELLFFEQVFVR